MATISITDEYGTHAPSGHTCRRCERPIRPDERVRREFVSGTDPGVRTNVAYQHTGATCPRPS
ncbi:hypothetical protein HHL19_10255 [Streptomyces sp. R302]|uniref:hypothetical protein n=1 Tax=unclassified Streptomyces TaxID=2593676 RepID=UPI00145EA657|nr:MULTISPECIES: hypothetical protein [unclassified Streptomyces]NML50050.1 hypothetical protein [Streptomyces sp. R301]NML79041.1 hypothetical protein [Streptomyces sp. R302]